MSLASASVVYLYGHQAKDLEPMRMVSRWGGASGEIKGSMYEDRSLAGMTMGSPPVKRTSRTWGMLAT